MTTKSLQALLIGALLASSAAFADQSIDVSIVNGKQQAAFSVGDSKCVLVNDTIRCTPVVLASN
jgi:serine/threonine protein phosphatase PrpC